VVAAAGLILAPFYRRRLGRISPSLPETGGRAIWLHAVSVGEVISCRELVARLRKCLPGVRILISTATAAGQSLARERLASLVDGIFYAPLDVPFAVRRVLRRIRPRLVIVAETEIWPNLFRETKRSGASLLLVNARISDRSAARYRRFRSFFGRVLGLADAILAQSDLDRRRLLEAGAPPERVEVGGNLKFDVQDFDRPAPAEIVSLIERARPRAVILAGSTRETEEAPVLASFRELSGKLGRLLLILAPRHPDRFPPNHGFLRRSQLTPETTLDLPGVLLIDTLGELASLYGLADAVFVGGSLVNWGGHNVLEPAMLGKPIVVGPHMQNFRAIADSLLAAGGLVQVDGASGLAPALGRLLEHPGEAAAIGERARRCAEAHRGATGRAAGRAEQLYHLAAPCSPPPPLRRLLLWLPARIWETVARFRKPPPPRRLNTLTVSIGNLTAGGAGKTPFVLWLLEQLQARGLSCAVLTRGYRRADSEPLTIVEPGAAVPPERTGDEAQILLRRFRVPLGIAANRHAAGLEIERRFHPDVILLDDGFQHRGLARDLDVVLIDVTDPFGGREFLPLGRLREPLEALSRAGVLVLTRVEPGERWDGLQQELRRWNPRAPILFARVEPLALVEAATGQERPLSLIGGRRIAAFCGIANPGAFFAMLEQIGAVLVEKLRYPDHHRYSARDRRRLASSTAEALVTTEKDLVNLGAPLDRLYWLKTRLVVQGAEQLLDRIAAREGAVR